jgi:hypothetical protein
MQPETRLSDEAREELRREMLDKDNIAARMRYVTQALALIINIGDWLAIDSWLGGGKVNNTDLREEFGQAFSEFRAVSTVVCMAAELAEAAVDMAKKSRYYAVAAVIRQLIECEYLLTLFKTISNMPASGERVLQTKCAGHSRHKGCASSPGSPTRSIGTIVPRGATQLRRAPGCLRSLTQPADHGRTPQPNS